jgi:protein-tyrosine phosphatase
VTRRILVVCTANVCRSPVAERLLARHVTSTPDAIVRSAGTHGGRLGVHRDTATAAAEVGIDLADHTSRALDVELLRTDGADLVLTMTREHLRDTVALDPTAWPRTFTMRELVRRAPAGAPDLGSFLAAAGEGRRASDLLGASADDDIADPYGRPLAQHRAMVVELDELAHRLARLLPLG